MVLKAHEAREAESPKTTLAALAVEQLKREGVTAIFGIPGGPATPIFDALYHEPSIRTVVARHEAGAAFMALGYARLSGRLGVCVVTTGPGTTNALTAVAAAKMDSLPILVLSAQVATATFGRGAAQDSYERIDVVDMFRSATKMSVMAAHPRNFAATLRQAIRLAMTGRRGPVHVNIPSDLMRRQVPLELEWPHEYRSFGRTFDREAVKQAAERLLEAERPAILAGHGVNLSGAQAELLELAELLSLPVATTPKGKGAFSEEHPLSLGVFGVASSVRAETYLLSGTVDVLFVMGSSLHECSTEGWDARLKPGKALLHLDVDAGVIGRNFPVAVPMLGDVKTTLRELLHHLRRLIKQGEHPPRLRPQSYGDSLEIPLVMDPAAMHSPQIPIKPQRLMHELNRALPPDAAIFLDSGNNTFWAVHYLKANGKNVFVNGIGEFGAMGFGVAACLGAKIAAPGRPVVAVVGDGGVGMLGMEISTAATYGIPVVWVVLNDSRLNAVYHGQRLQYAGRTIGCDFKRMDLVLVAEGLGAKGYRIDFPDDIAPALREALSCGGPALLDVHIDAGEAPPIHARIRSLERFFAGMAVE